MQIKVNGELRESAAKTVQELVASLGLATNQIAIERNREIVPRSQYGQIPIVEGDVIEIVRFIGGG